MVVAIDQRSLNLQKRPSSECVDGENLRARWIVASLSTNLKAGLMAEQCANPLWGVRVNQPFDFILLGTPLPTIKDQHCCRNHLWVEQFHQARQCKCLLSGLIVSPDVM